MSRKALLGLALAIALSAGDAQSATLHARRGAAAATESRPSPKPSSKTILLGRSYDGRPIFVTRVGDPDGARVLVFGCIHGNEPAGIAVALALKHVRTTDDVWIVPNLNPDGVAAGTRQNARGVDLNANWSSEWQGGGNPGDAYYGGPYPFSERETQLAHNLVLRIHPLVTIWYHQHMDVVWAFGPSTHAGAIYARVSGMQLYHQPWLAGTATNWQNHRFPRTAALTIELPAGSLSPQQIRQHTRAVLIVARLLGPRRVR
ncbi:MAG TPA: M14 family metallopeptidase [Solirubrobacteraceae bacterium]